MASRARRGLDLSLHSPAWLEALTQSTPCTTVRVVQGRDMETGHGRHLKLAI